MREARDWADNQDGDFVHFFCGDKPEPCCSDEPGADCANNDRACGDKPGGAGLRCVLATPII
jgi:hypothetical protein